MAKKRISIKDVKFTKANSGMGFKFTKKGDSIEGYFIKTSIIKINEKSVTQLHFETEVGNAITCLASAVLERIGLLDKDTPIRITYLGKAGKGAKKYNNFDIELPEGVELPENPDRPRKTIKKSNRKVSKGSK